MVLFIYLFIFLFTFFFSVYNAMFMAVWSLGDQYFTSAGTIETPVVVTTITNLKMVVQSIPFHHGSELL